MSFCSIPWVLMAAVAVVVILPTAVHGGHQNQGYFQYANVPAYGQYEFGYHRGNPDHYTSRYEQAKDWRFRTKVRWGDKKGGYGEHYWDYNHVDKGKHGHGHKAEEQGHGHHEQQEHGHVHGNHGWQGGYSEPATSIVPATGPPAARYAERRASRHGHKAEEHGHGHHEQQQHGHGHSHHGWQGGYSKPATSIVPATGPPVARYADRRAYRHHNRMDRYGRPI